MRPFWDIVVNTFRSGGCILRIVDSKRNQQVFIGLFLLAGVLHVVEDWLHNVPAPDYSLVTLCFCFVFSIYSALLLIWIRSVYSRLLPTKARGYLITMTLLMLLYLCLRVYRYRVALSAAALRLTWFAFYLPMTVIPALFWMVCVRVARGETRRGWEERLLLIPAALFSVLILTNDLHHLVFVPKPGIGELIGSNGTYTYRLPFYLTYAWMILAVAAGLFLLIRACGHGKSKKTILLFLAVTFVWFGLIELHRLKKIVEFIPPYEAPEIHVFSMLAICEICIQKRLIPHNVNYSEFFEELPMPVLITDREFCVVYRSAEEIHANSDQLSAALEAPIQIRLNQKLSGKRISGGFAFWLVDETEVQKANEALSEANELLESENTLIKYENRQKEQTAYLRSRHHIYHEIAEQMYPWQKRIEELLNSARPGTPAFRRDIASVSVLNAYVKRKTNLLLMVSEQKEIPLWELFLAVSESGRYLSYADLKTSVDESGFMETQSPDAEALLPSGLIIALYDTFEILAEQLLGSASLLMVSYSQGTLRLAANPKTQIATADTPLPVRSDEHEGIQSLTVCIREGGGMK